jgi:UPF0716 family protein affecting phage T7 exclusion
MDILNLHNIELLMNFSLDFILTMLIVSTSLGLILLSASKLGKTILEHGHKALTTVAATTTIYNNINKSKGGSGSNSDSDEDDKDKVKDKDKDKSDTEDKNKTTK